MNHKGYREVLIFVIGTTPQIITETLYALSQECRSAIIPDEIHIITTSNGKQKIEQGLIAEGHLSCFVRKFSLPSIPFSEDSIHLITGDQGQPLDDIREGSHNEALAETGLYQASGSTSLSF